LAAFFRFGAVALAEDRLAAFFFAMMVVAPLNELSEPRLCRLALATLGFGSIASLCHALF
jgi:hypothetical protein